MLLLQVLGGLSLRDDGTVAAGRAAQRRRLALLALLAMAKDRRATRDKLIAFLWPESATDDARHSLADSVYVLRTALGEGVVLAAGDDLVLNEERVACDALEFSRAIERGDLEAAVRLYTGAFLDGVFFSECAELERWIDATRAQLAAEYRGALEHLALAADRRGARAESVAWWRRLVAEDPASSRGVLGLMGALAAIGDSTGALQVARVHEALVQRELGASPDPAIASLVAEIRRGAIRPAIASAVPTAAVPSTSNAPIAAISGTSGPPASVPRTEPAKRPYRVNVRRYVVPGAILGLALIGAVWIILGSASSPPAAGARSAASIAVLPLTDLSGSVEGDRFADAMTEELTTVLATSGQMRVVASTSTSAFKGHHTDARRIADSLGVTSLLEGSVQRSGRRLRLALRLIDGKTGATSWSQSYERDFGDVFDVQDEIGRVVARELNVGLNSAGSAEFQHRRTSSIAAYELYLRGRDPTLLRNDSTARAGLEYFNQAIALDSNFASAYAGLAHMYGRLALSPPHGVRVHDLYEQARSAALKAVTLDSMLAEAHVELGFAESIAHRYANATRELERGLELEPSFPRAREYLAVVYEFSEQPQAALEQAQLEILNNPLSPAATAEYARALYFNGRCDDAIVQLGKIADVRPPILRAANTRALCYAQEGQWQAAVDAVRSQAVSSAGGAHSLAVLGYVLARRGQRAEAERVLRELVARRNLGTAGPSDVAMVTAGLGDVDETLRWFESAVDEFSLEPDLMGPALASIRRDPRFARIRSRLNAQNR